MSYFNAICGLCCVPTMQKFGWILYYHYWYRTKVFLENCYFIGAPGLSRGWGRGVSYPGPARFGDPAVTQKYKVHQNAPFWKKFKNFLSRGAPRKCLGALWECFPGPRCGSRRACGALCIHSVDGVMQQEYFAHHSISGDVLPHMIYLDHGDKYTFHVHVYLKSTALFSALSTYNNCCFDWCAVWFLISVY